MINRQFRVYIKVLLLSIGLISCTVIKKKNKGVAKTEATNYDDSVLSNKYITGEKSVKDSLKTEDVISFYKRFMQSYILGGSLNRNDDNPEVNIRNMKMVFIGDNWYKISFGKQPENSYRVKIIRQRGSYKICDIINNNTI